MLLKQHGIRQHKAMAEEPARLRKAADAVEHGIASYTEKVATTASRRPWATIVVSLICAAALATGLGEIKNEDDPAKLFVPADSRAQKDKVWVEDRFGDQDDVSTALLWRAAPAHVARFPRRASGRSRSLSPRPTLSEFGAATMISAPRPSTRAT